MDDLHKGLAIKVFVYDKNSTLMEYFETMHDKRDTAYMNLQQVFQKIVGH